jgi:defect-in-organelle-trafficking protein DotB
MHNQIATTLISSLRVIIQQRLLARADGKGRIAVKEYLVFNSLHRDKLYDVSIDEIIPTIKKMVEEDGQPLVVDAQKKFKEGLISKDDLVQIETETIKHP